MSSLEDALYIDHSFFAKLEFFSHLIYLLVITLNHNLGQSSILANQHFNLDLLLS